MSAWPVRPSSLPYCSLLLGTAPAAQAADKITFGLDWIAEPEYGGYYEALAKGIYKKYGLDVTIVPGGPEVNNAQRLVGGRLTFDITSNSFLALNFVQEHIPFVAIAAGFQKDPDVLIAHPGTGNDSFAALKGKPIAVSADTRASWWNYLKAKYGYSDAQLRPYGFSLAPYFTNQQDIQEAYVTDEPFLIHEKTGQWPVVLMLSDSGFNGYASLIATSEKLVKTDPGLVQRFIDASTRGLVRLSLRQPRAGLRRHPAGQSGHDAGADAIRLRPAERARHRRFRRHQNARASTP